MAPPPKISPIGALLKYASFRSRMNGSWSARAFDGRLPSLLNASICPSIPVRYSASSAASLGCLLCLGTARKEPPQLPPLPGALAMSHFPALASPEFALIAPVSRAVCAARHGPRVLCQEPHVHRREAGGNVPRG